MIRSPIRTKRALFDVGASGPLVGFIVAIPALLFGILHAKVVPGLADPNHVSAILGAPLILHGLAADLLSSYARRKYPSPSRRPRRLGRTLRHLAQSATRSATRRRPHPPLPEPSHPSLLVVDSPVHPDRARFLPFLGRLVRLGRAPLHHPLLPLRPHLRSRTAQPRPPPRRRHRPHRLHPLLHALPIPRIAKPSFLFGLLIWGLY